MNFLEKYGTLLLPSHTLYCKYIYLEVTYE